MGADMPKQFLELDGVPLVQFTNPLMTKLPETIPPFSARMPLEDTTLALLNVKLFPLVSKVCAPALPPRLRLATVTLD